MNRRGFITRLAGVIGLGAVAGAVAAKPVEPPKFKCREFYGVGYAYGHKAFDNLGEETHAMSTAEMLPHECPPGNLTEKSMEDAFIEMAKRAGEHGIRLSIKPEYVRIPYGRSFVTTRGRA